MEQAILDQLVKLSGEFGSFKTEMKISMKEMENRLINRMDQKFKEQDEKIEGIRTELTEKMEKGFKAQDEKMERRFKAQDEKIEGIKTELMEKMEKGFKAQDEKMERRFKAQDEKIEGIRTELTEKMEKGFKEQRELSEKINHDLLWNVEDASIIIKDVYNCLNDKIDNNYFELRKKVE